MLKTGLAGSVGGSVQKTTGVKKMDLSLFRCQPGKKLETYETVPPSGITKEEALARLDENRLKMAALQDKLYAERKNALLLILQGMDASGKDSAIKRVLTGLNPQGVEVTSFKAPTAAELEHDYMWRTSLALPPKGKIGVFNRSYYEDVLVVRVHGLVPGHGMGDKEFWRARCRQIRNHEEYLLENGVVPVKIFFHISKEEQARRLLKRIDDPGKNWKFDAADIKERAYWEDYQRAYQKAFESTSTDQIPWYLLPSDKKWYARFLLSEILVEELKRLRPEYPVVSEQKKEMLEHYRALLEQGR